MKSLKKYMKSSDFRVGYQWLKDNGFSDKDIVYIKRVHDKNGIKFCKKTFYSQDLQEMKDELKIINENETRNFYKSLFKSVNVDVNKALKMLYAN